MLPHVDIGSLRLPSYAVMLVLALAAGTVVAVERGRRDGVPSKDVVAIAVVACLAGLIGARMWSWIVELWPLTGELRVDGLTSTTGFSVFGGLVAGALATWAAARLRGLPFLSVADTFAPGVALAIGIGRIGCLLAGCCFGRPTLFPIALVFTDWDTAARPVGVPLHATQLYEMVGCVLLAVAVWRVPHHSRGARLGALLTGYGVVRLACERLRADYRGLIVGVPTPTLVSLALVVVGALLLGAAVRATPNSIARAAPAGR